MQGKVIPFEKIIESENVYQKISSKEELLYDMILEFSIQTYDIRRNYFRKIRPALILRGLKHIFESWQTLRDCI